MTENKGKWALVLAWTGAAILCVIFMLVFLAPASAYDDGDFVERYTQGERTDWEGLRRHRTRPRLYVGDDPRVVRYPGERVRRDIRRFRHDTPYYTEGRGHREKRCRVTFDRRGNFREICRPTGRVVVCRHDRLCYDDDD